MFGEIGAWLFEQCGLALHVDESSFRQRRNKRGEPTIQGRIAYTGPLASPSTPKVRLDLTADEAVVRPLERRPVFHPFSDVDTVGHRGDHLADVRSYSLPELMGEKLRALAERCRPRDLYDVIHTHRHPDLIGRDGERSRTRADRPACRRAVLAAPILDGNLLLFVRNDHGQPRSYRVDRIRGASIEPQTFTPRYRGRVLTHVRPRGVSMSGPQLRSVASWSRATRAEVRA